MALSGGKHVLLSYNWNSKDVVNKVYDVLRDAGIPVWFDIKGGMKDNMYDSMSEGIQNASMVCCFMTPDYQKSDNCALELQYAKKRRVRIIPCMLTNRKSWTPSDWLGLITAPEIAIDLQDHSDVNIRAKAKELVDRIKQQPSASTSPVDDEPSYLFELIRYEYIRNSRIQRIMNEEKSFPIEQSYINLAMVETKEQQEKEKKLRDTQHTDAIIGTFEEIYGTKTSIDVKDIFKKCQDHTKQVLVFGRAGIGKSTFCRYVANQWANGVILSEYKLVILLPLRNLTKDNYPELSSGSRYALIDLVQTEYFSCNALSEKEKQFLREQFSKTEILWLLDGYDEIAQNLPAHLTKLFEDLRKTQHHILTSRPYMNKLSYGVQMEITGFTDNNIAEYVKQFFAQIEDTITDASNEGQKLMSFLKLNPSIWGVAHIPVNLELICSLWGNTDWSETKTLTMTSLYDEITEWLCLRYLTKKDPKNTNMLKDEVYEDCRKELAFLDTLAYLGMDNKSIILKPDLLEKAEKESNWSLKNYPELLNIGILKPLNDKAIGHSNDRKKDHYFVHLSFQEYFAARYLVTALNGSATQKSVEFIQRHKYNRRFGLMLSFASGLLANSNNTKCIDAFWDAIKAEPLDQVGIRHMQVVLYCMEETGNNKSFKRYNELLNHITNCIECVVNSEHIIVRRYLEETLRRSPSIVNEKQLIETFTTLLQTNNANTKENVVSLIAELQIFNPQPQFIHLLVTALGDANDEVKKYACEALGKMGHKAAMKDVIRALVTALGVEDYFVSRNVCKALDQMAEKSATNDVIDALVIALGDTNKDIRRRAYEVLGQMGEKAATKHAIGALVTALTDANNDVKRYACQALSQMGEKAATTDVFAALVNALGHANRDVREAACEALGRIGEKAATKDMLGALVTTLGHADYHIREAACKALGQIGVKAVTNEVIGALVTALTDADRHVIEAAGVALCRMGENVAMKNVAGALVTALEGADDRVRIGACDVLGQMGEKAATNDVIGALVTALGDVNWFGRWTTCIALGKMGEKAATNDAIGALVTALSDDNDYVREYACEALGQMGEKAATNDVIAALLTAMEDTISAVRSNARVALGEMGEKAAPNIMIGVWLTALSDDNDYVRHYACKALGQMGEKAATNDVIVALVTALGDADHFVQQGACKALGQMGEKAATNDVIAALLTAMEDVLSVVSEAACVALGEMGEKATNAAIGAIVTALGDKNYDVRRHAFGALGQLREKAATNDVIVALVTALGDTISDGRSNACAALCLIGETSATNDVIGALVIALGHVNNDVKRYAARALGLFGEKAATEDVIGALVTALGNDDDDFRQAACLALCRMGKKAPMNDMIGAVVTALGHANRDVRQNVCEALGQIGEKAATDSVINGLLGIAEESSVARRSLRNILVSSSSLSYIELNTVSKLFKYWNSSNFDWELSDISLENLILAYLDKKFAEWCSIIRLHALLTGCAVTIVEQTIVVYGNNEPVSIPTSTLCVELADSFVNQRGGFYLHGEKAEKDQLEKTLVTSAVCDVM